MFARSLHVLISKLHLMLSINQCTSEIMDNLNYTGQPTRFLELTLMVLWVVLESSTEEYQWNQFNQWTVLRERACGRIGHVWKGLEEDPLHKDPRRRLLSRRWNRVRITFGYVSRYAVSGRDRIWLVLMVPSEEVYCTIAQHDFLLNVRLGWYWSACTYLRYN